MLLACHRRENLPFSVGNRRPVIFLSCHRSRDTSAPYSRYLCHVILQSRDGLRGIAGIIPRHSCKIIFINSHGLGCLALICPCNLCKIILFSGYRFHLIPPRTAPFPSAALPSPLPSQRPLSCPRIWQNTSTRAPCPAQHSSTSVPCPLRGCT